MINYLVKIYKNKISVYMLLYDFDKKFKEYIVNFFLQ
jgi:hypothetical protein